MKQKIFTLVLMLAMVFVASSAWAVNENVVTPGGTYSYSLSGITSVYAATANVTYGGDDVTISGYQLDGADISNNASGNIPANTTNAVLSFNILFAPTATDGAINVIITETRASGCSNFINFLIDVNPAPVIDYTIADNWNDADCQRTNSTPQDNRSSADDVASGNNTITYTVTGTVTNAPNIPYSATFDVTQITASLGLTGYAFGSFATGTGGGTTVASGNTVTVSNITANATSFTVTFNATFTTTSGIADQTPEVSVSNASITVGTTTPSVFDETATANNSTTSTVKGLPQIGSFVQ